MSPGRKVAAFLVALVLVAGLGAAVGAAVGPIDTGSDGSAADHDGTDDEGADHDGTAAPPADRDGGGGAISRADALGTSSVQDGYRLVLGTSTSDELRFTVQDPDDVPVVATEVVHERPLHLIVVGRDLTTFLHLHPEVEPDGTWRVAWPSPGPEPGSYRVVADLTPVGGPPLVLGADLTRPGAVPEPLTAEVPAPATEASAGELDVAMTGTPQVGDTELSFAVTRRGEPHEVQPYLGARGHLVALRATDLAYSHVHPHDGAEGPIAFTASFPSAGTYRLFLDLDTGDGIVTAAFTVEVPETGATTGPGDEGDADTTIAPPAGSTGEPTTTEHPHEGGDGHGH